MEVREGGKVMSDTRDKPCMSHYPEVDHYCVFKKQGCEYYKPEEER